MRIAIERAGFDPNQADKLRRSLASFRSAANVNHIAEYFLKGLLDHGVDEAFAHELFGYLKGYAHYGFPESHSISFATISYKSAYLKCHYPAEFLCGLINSQPMGFYSVDTLIQSARRAGVVVLPIDPRVSEWDARMEEPQQSDCAGVRTGPRAVRMGFREVNGLSKEAVEAMVAERERAPFRDLQDFIVRSRFSTAVLERLAMANAFRCFGQDERSTLWKSLVPAATLPDAETHAQFEQLTLFESISAEHEAFNYSTQGNMMMAIRKDNPTLPRHTSRDLREAKSKIWLTVSGITIAMQRPPTAKGACFITLEDEFGTIDMILRKSIYEKYREIVRSQRLLIARGRVQIFGVGRSLLVEEILEPRQKAMGRNLVPGGHPRTLAPF